MPKKNLKKQVYLSQPIVPVTKPKKQPEIVLNSSKKYKKFNNKEIKDTDLFGAYAGTEDETNSDNVDNTDETLIKSIPKEDH
jgi:hypothetical protein